MTRLEHILFHLGDAAAAALGVVHALVDPPPAGRVEQPFLTGCRQWGAPPGGWPPAATDSGPKAESSEPAQTIAAFLEAVRTWAPGARSRRIRIINCPACGEYCQPAGKKCPNGCEVL